MDVVRLAVICGPTAAGKSALAMTLAQAGGAAIISADSRQVYRGFDIGTAKATPQERALVPHHGIDVAEPAERYSAARWMSSVASWIDAAQGTGHRALIVGGTGLYLRTLSEPLFEEPLLDPVARRELALTLESLSVEALRERCRALDPARAGLGRTQLLRAIEVAELSGRPISAWHRTHARAGRYEVRYLLVDPGPPLRERIETRVDDMLGGGWIDEVQHLITRVAPEAPAWNATGYRAIRQVVEGTLPVQRARELIVIATRQYAKRQRTWFRHQLATEHVVHVNPAEHGAVERVMTWWDEENRS